MAAINTITKSVVIAPGESFTLPKGAIVTSTTGVLDTECVDLPTPEPIMTYNFIFAINEDNNDDHPVGGVVNIDSMLIDGVNVPLSFTAMNTDNTGNSVGVNIWNSEVTTNNNLLTAYPIKLISVAANYANAGHSDLVYVQMQMPESYQKKVILKITNDKFPNGLYLFGALYP